MLNRKRFDSCVLNLFTILFFSFALFASGEDILTFGTNAIVLIVMRVFIGKGLGSRKKQTPGLYALRGLSCDLVRLTEQISQIEDSDAEKVRALLYPEQQSEESFKFQNPVFRASIDEYFKENDSLVRRGKAYYNCDISDYINEDLIIKIGNTGFNDFLSSVMTGLGILGTFVGLAIGLHSFNTETAEAMTNSIAPLIEGIKIAFYTSIFGVAFSLLYGTLYKHRYNEAANAMTEFISVFYKQTGARPGNEAVSQLLQYQEEQTDSINQFAEEISVALADAIQQSLVPALNQIPSQLSQEIKSTVTPIMQDMSDAILMSTEEMTKKLSETQVQGVETLVNNFLDQMNNAVGGQMDNLKESIQSICKWQEETSSRLKEVVESVCENAESISVINEDLKEVVSQLASYIGKMDAAAGKLETATENVGVLAENAQDAISDYSTIVENTAQLSQQIGRQHKETAALVEKQREQIHAESEYIQTQCEKLKETCNGISEKFDVAANQLYTVSGQLSNDLSEAMTKTYAQFDSQLAKAITHFSGTLAELRDIVERTPKLIDTSSEKMRSEVASHMETIQSGQLEYSTLISQMVERIAENTSLINNTIERLKLNSANPDEIQVT